MNGTTEIKKELEETKTRLEALEDMMSEVEKQLYLLDLISGDQQKDAFAKLLSEVNKKLIALYEKK